jgi:hypothetical protein
MFPKDSSLKITSGWSEQFYQRLALVTDTDLAADVVKQTRFCGGFWKTSSTSFFTAARLPTASPASSFATPAASSLHRQNDDAKYLAP